METATSNIPSDYQKEIYANNSDFPESIFDIIGGEDDEKIEHLCEGIIAIQNNFGKNFDFGDIELWFSYSNFDIDHLIDFLGANGTETFLLLKPKIQQLFELSKSKMSLEDIYKEGYSPEEVIDGLTGSLSHGRKTYPECYKDVIQDIVRKTGIITLGHGEQGIFRQILTHKNGTIGYKKFHYDQKSILEREFKAQQKSYEMILDAQDDGLLPEYIYPIYTIGTLERARKRNKLGKEVINDAITLEALQDLNKLRGKQGGDHPRITGFLHVLMSQMETIGIKPKDTDTPKNVMVGNETGEKIIQFCRDNLDINLCNEDRVYPNIDPANWEFFEV